MNGRNRITQQSHFRKPASILIESLLTVRSGLKFSISEFIIDVAFVGVEEELALEDEQDITQVEVGKSYSPSPNKFLLAAIKIQDEQ